MIIRAGMSGCTSTRALESLVRRTYPEGGILISRFSDDPPCGNDIIRDQPVPQVHRVVTSIVQLYPLRLGPNVGAYMISLTTTLPARYPTASEAYGVYRSL
jgi:hypothetical protein